MPPFTQRFSNPRPNPSTQAVRRCAGPVVLGLAAFGLLLLVLQATGQSLRPAHAQSLTAVAAQVLTLTLAADTGQANQAEAVNGKFITYTLRITASNINLENLFVTTTLPLGLLPEDVVIVRAECSQINYVYNRRSFPDVRGSTRQITQTQGFGWRGLSGGKCNSAGHFSLHIRVYLYGRPDGSEIETSAVGVVNQNGETNVLASVSQRNRVRVQVAANGSIGSSRLPTWLSNDAGGTFAQDWGDYDSDGFLDLALGSAAGLSVYRNNRGQLQWHWSDPARAPAQGVRWADVTGDGKLELVSVGVSGTVGGFNYVYGLTYDADSGTTQVLQVGSFLNNFTAVRVLAADFNQDGKAEIVASSTQLNASTDCPVRYVIVNLPTFDERQNIKIDDNCFASTAMAAGDINNDGVPELIISAFPNKLLAFGYKSDSGFGKLLEIDASSGFPPYDLALGDYDNDGYLDLAAAYPVQREVRIYHNQGGTNAGTFGSQYYVIPTNRFLTPLTLDWGDFTGDGKLDLLVADDILKIYKNISTDTAPKFALVTPAPFDFMGSDQRWSARAVRLRTHGDPDVMLTNRVRPSVLVNTFVAHLQPSQAYSQPFASASIVLANLDGAGRQDMLLGGDGSEAGPMRLFLNASTLTPTLLNPVAIPSAGLGPRQVSVGDVNGDGRLEVLVGTLSNARLFTYPLNPNSLPIWQSAIAAPSGRNFSAKFGDMNGDGLLDAIVGSRGTQGGLAVYLNTGGSLAATPVWSSSVPLDIASIALGDMNNDTFLDIGLGLINSPSLVLRNNTNNTFSPMWRSPTSVPTPTLALADANNDGLPDITLGGVGNGFAIYENVQGRILVTPSFTTPFSQISSLAWADWDHDGDLDLAVGNLNQPVQVFANINSRPGALALSWVWQSQESAPVTDLAWGDVNGDGNLDLAVSQSDPTKTSGVYLNTSSGWPSNPAQAAPLRQVQQAPLIISVERPDGSDEAYGYSASRLVGLDRKPVTITFAITNPNVIAQGKSSPVMALQAITYAYSLDGGSNWRVASPYTPLFTSLLTFPITLTHYVTQLAFVWDVKTDGAVSNQALFRVRGVVASAAGPVAQAAVRGVSPPFQVRALGCTWPANPHFIATWNGHPNPPQPGTPIAFRGGITTTQRDGAGLSNHIYEFDFGDNTGRYQAQSVPRKTFVLSGTYQIRITVRNEACPTVRQVSNVYSFVVGDGRPIKRQYLPLVLTKSRFGTGTTNVTTAQPKTDAAIVIWPQAPQISTLTGQQNGQMLRLAWQPPDSTRPIAGYEVYRQSANGGLARVAVLPPEATIARVPLVCGSSVWVTTRTAATEEALPSTNSIYMGCAQPNNP